MAHMKGATHVPQCAISIFFYNFVLSAYSWLELAFLQLELLVIAGYHTAVNPNLEIVQITRQVGKVWLPVTRYHSLSPVSSYNTFRLCLLYV